MSGNDPIQILYEDNDILVCMKPFGVSTESSDGKIPCIQSLVSQMLTANHRPSKVFGTHRLDTTTIGVCLLAKNEKTLAALSSAFADHKVQKEYLAVVEGIPDPVAGTLRHWLFHDSRINKSFVSEKKKSSAKEAILDYESIDSTENCSLVHIILHTGRTHQIRAQMSFIGHPLIGDKKYGSHVTCSQSSLLSYRMSFKHPVTGKPITVTAPLPDIKPFSVFAKQGKTNEI